LIAAHAADVDGRVAVLAAASTDPTGVRRGERLYNV